MHIYIQKFFINDKVRNYFKHLYRNNEYLEAINRYERDKIKLFFLVIITGILAALVYKNISNGSEIINGSMIKRNGYGLGDKKVNLIVSSENIGVAKEIEIDVSERRYSDEEIQNMYKEFTTTIEDTILGDNLSNDNVCYKMNFLKKIEGYPFDVAYETDIPMLINDDGSIIYDKLSEMDAENKGVLVGITVKAKYYDFKENYSFYVRIFQNANSFEDRFEKAVLQQVHNKNISAINDEYIELPDKVGGVDISYTDNVHRTEYVIVVFFIIIAVLLSMAKDEEVKKEYIEREKQLISDYPNIVNRFALYFNAGMTVKAAFGKICDEYEKEKSQRHIERFAYEEMLIANSAMKEGVGELKAYDDFANACGNQKYRSFVNLLSQAVTKGKKDMAYILIEENANAFNERRLRAKRLSEEAGTKLLMPMLMMLSIVIVMIIYPAFSSL